MKLINSIISQILARLKKFPTKGYEILHKIRTIDISEVEAVLLSYKIEPNKSYANIDEVVKDITR